MVQNGSNISSQTPADNQSPPFPFKPLHLIVVAAVLVILSSLGTYLVLKSKVQQQPTTSQPSSTQPQAVPTDILNEAQGWKTYENKKYNYVVQYPPRVLILDSSEGKKEGNENLNSIMFGYSNIGSGLPLFYISIFPSNISEDKVYTPLQPVCNFII